MFFIASGFTIDRDAIFISLLNTWRPCRVADALIAWAPAKGNPTRVSVTGRQTIIVCLPIPLDRASRALEGDERRRGRSAWIVCKGTMWVDVRYGRYVGSSGRCSRGIGVGTDGAERVRSDITDRMYGCVEGDVWGSPAELMGNLRERLEASERRKTGTESGWGEVGEVKWFKE
jgi:hypothetical protein